MIAWTDGADDRGDAIRRLNDFRQRIERMPNDVRIEKPIKRRVALDRYFRKDDQIGSILLCPFNRAQDSPDVAFAISVGRVDLADGNAHL